MHNASMIHYIYIYIYIYICILGNEVTRGGFPLHSSAGDGYYGLPRAAHVGQ